MSVKLDIWTAVKAKLAALKINGTINHYAIWNNQINKEEDEIPFEFPAVFVEFTSMPWDTNLKADNANQFNQQASPTEGWMLTFHIIFENYENETSSFELNDPKMDLIIEAFHLLEINEFAQELKRTEERQDTDHPNVIHWEVDYKTWVQETFEDSTVEDATNDGTTDIGLVINGTIDD